MDVRVAVAYRVGAPVSIETVHLRGPHASAGRCQHDYRSQYQSSPQSFGRKTGHDPLRQSEESLGRHCVLSNQTDKKGGVLFFQMHRQCSAYAPGAGVLPQGLGCQRHHRGGKRGATDVDPTISAGHAAGMEKNRIWRCQRTYQRAENC